MIMSIQYFWPGISLCHNNLYSLPTLLRVRVIWPVDMNIDTTLWTHCADVNIHDSVLVRW